MAAQSPCGARPPDDITCQCSKPPRHAGPHRCAHGVVWFTARPVRRDRVIIDDPYGLPPRSDPVFAVSLLTGTVYDIPEPGS